MLGDAFNRVSKIMSRCWRRKFFAILTIQINCFFNDFTKLCKDLPFVIAVATTQE